MRIAENVSEMQSDIDAWANPWALKTGTVDRLYTAVESWDIVQLIKFYSLLMITENKHEGIQLKK